LDRSIRNGRDLVSDEEYVARIAELEAEVEALKAELAKWKALAGGTAKVEASMPGSLGLSALDRVPPSHVNADGTAGMRRGVSGVGPPPSRDVDEGT
jgi:hypothetical protein